MTVVWWLVVPAGACEGSEDPTTLAAALDDADRTLSELDADGFAAAVDRAKGIVGCLNAPIRPELAARVHRAVGIQAFGARDPLALSAFAAARRIQPEHRFPTTLFPPGSPVDAAWTAFPLQSLRTEALQSPDDGWIALDGSRSEVRAADLPVVYQQIGWDGLPVVSRYLLPGDLQPPVPASPPPLSDPRRLRLVLATAGSGATAAALWALSLHGHARYVDADDPVPDDRLDGLRTRTNVLVAGSLLGVGLCAASGALLVATW